jgi:hypothetical protein
MLLAALTCALAGVLFLQGHFAQQCWLRATRTPSTASPACVSQQTLPCQFAHSHPLLLLLLLLLQQTTKAHMGGVIEELVVHEGLQVTSCSPFKGDMDCELLAACIERYTPAKVAFVRVEAGTNLIGGQPFSLQNLRDVRAVREWQSHAGLAIGRGATAAAGAQLGHSLAAS